MAFKWTLCLTASFIRLWRTGLQAEHPRKCEIHSRSKRFVSSPKPAVQWIMGSLSLGLKQVGCEANQSPVLRLRMSGAKP
jgi:hypothetical protein